nr:hypothetical protein [Holospora curviuscula]
MENFDFKTLLANKSYDADEIVHYAGSNKAVILIRSMRKNLREFDAALYKALYSSRANVQQVNPFQAHYTQI